MIEQLNNCPNCGGRLNEAGRCVFCGSKVYDFAVVNFSGRNRGGPSAPLYIRIQTEMGTLLAPVRSMSAELTMSRDCAPTLDLHCLVVGDTVLIENDEQGGNET